MRKNHLSVLGKVQDTGENEGEKVDKNTQGMGNQVSCHKRQKLSSQHDCKSETLVSNCPRTEKVISSKPETLVLKRRRSYSECDNLTTGPQNVCKKTKVNQLYTDYCGRNSFMATFFKLLDDDVIQDFLWMDSCAIISDKYLLAMVYTYFRRAELGRREYNRMHFFIALYLANDMEEDEEEEKYDIFPWALGKNWRELYPSFLRKKDMFWKKIGYRGVVSKLTCDEIMSIVADHPIWRRTRRNHHGGAWREYMRVTSTLCTSPRGPGSVPFQCIQCEAPESKENSPAITSDYCSCSSQSSSEDENYNSRFDLQDLKNVLQRSNNKRRWFNTRK
ncbi:LOW QUALITY PROTEIN: speedy protein 1-A-like [Acropora millepora]|uniref:LOW QUALITY PROTEIN: speedy protein 1-A-like n=1 Tax=Acropora millepora TaxID=45264 RepID=UPI001CF567D8|nr:LOW QUALITY PROTEIN: speedy protein 1-A-like [Acropora millepora]